MLRLLFVFVLLESACIANISITELTPENKHVEIKFSQSNELTEFELIIHSSVFQSKKYWKTTLFHENKKYQDIENESNESLPINVIFKIQNEKLPKTKVWVRFGKAINERVYVIHINRYVQSVLNNEEYQRVRPLPSRNNSQANKQPTRRSLRKSSND